LKNGLLIGLNQLPDNSQMQPVLGAVLANAIGEVLAACRRDRQAKIIEW
jgi:hypothetical protein